MEKKPFVTKEQLDEIDEFKYSRIPVYEETIDEIKGILYVKDVLKNINNEEIDTPDLIKIAILHYQFESIHPFLDGNGRIGRLLIPLYIQSKGMLDKSCLYISDYIERNKDTYYDMLTRVRTHNDMIAWIKFFLEAVIETSKTAKEKFRNVVELTMEMDKVIMDLPVKPENAKKVLDVLYDEPIVSRKKILELIDIKPTTLNVCINALKEKNITIENNLHLLGRVTIVVGDNLIIGDNVQMERALKIKKNNF